MSVRFTGQPGAAGKDQWGAVRMRLACPRPSPFRTPLMSSTTPQITTEAPQRTQFQQLSTARLLPGRSARNRRRNGSRLTFDSTELPGAATLAPGHQHQQWIHRTRVERLNWCRQSSLCSDRYGSRAGGIFQTIPQLNLPVLRVHADERPSLPQPLISWPALVGQSCRGGCGRPG